MADRLLIIDDEPGVRKQIRWGLTELFEIEEAGSFDEALETFRRFRPAVATLDIRLSAPHASDGLEILRRMLDEDPSLKVIMVTADTDEHTATRAVEMGAWDYYTKPITTDELRVIAWRAAHVRRLQMSSNRAGASDVEPSRFSTWLGESREATRVERLLRSLAQSSDPVLILGENGTGRDLAARALHDLGPGAGAPFTHIECADGLPAGGSLPPLCTLFLDEVIGLDGASQARLPEWIDEVSDGRRVVVSAPEDLPDRVRNGEFPEASFRFLAALTVMLPPLRERREDILQLARQLVASIGSRFQTPAVGLTAAAEEALTHNPWPGNFRELEKRILGAALIAESDQLGPDDLWLFPGQERSGPLKASLDRMERDMVERALKEHNGNISRASTDLAVSRQTMHTLVRKHGIDLRPYRELAGR